MGKGTDQGGLGGTIAFAPAILDLLLLFFKIQFWHEPTFNEIEYCGMKLKLYLLSRRNLWLSPLHGFLL